MVTDTGSSYTSASATQEKYSGNFPVGIRVEAVPKSSNGPSNMKTPFGGFPIGKIVKYGFIFVASIKALQKFNVIREQHTNNES